jgi:hypothetical protein
VPVLLALRDDAGRPQGAPARVVTDPAGLATHTFRAPRDARGTLHVDARLDERIADAPARERLAAGAVTAARDLYDWDRVAALHLELYAKLIGGGAR